MTSPSPHRPAYPPFSPVNGQPATSAASNARSGGGRTGAGRGVGLALVLVLLGAAGALWFASRGNSRIDVVALNTSLRRGQVVDASDLTVARVAVDGASARLTSPAVARQALVGRTVLLDLAAGTLITPEMVGSIAPPAGDASVGVQVAAGALPSVRPRAGDWVQVVAGDSGGQAHLIGAPVQVTAVTSPINNSSTGDVVVYLIAPTGTARDIAGAAGTDTGVRLLGVRQ